MADGLRFVSRGKPQCLISIYRCNLRDGFGTASLSRPHAPHLYPPSYTTHNISPALLDPGPHVLGLRVGQGFCAQSPHDQFDPDAERSAILLLQLHGSGGGVVMRVASDGSWTSSSGPIQSDST